MSDKMSDKEKKENIEKLVEQLAAVKQFADKLTTFGRVLIVPVDPTSENIEDWDPLDEPTIMPIPEIFMPENWLDKLLNHRINEENESGYMAANEEKPGTPQRRNYVIAFDDEAKTCIYITTAVMSSARKLSDEEAVEAFKQAGYETSQEAGRVVRINDEGKTAVPDPVADAKVRSFVEGDKSTKH